jgi:hypothetical protein
LPLLGFIDRGDKPRSGGKPGIRMREAAEMSEIVRPGRWRLAWPALLAAVLAAAPAFADPDPPTRVGRIAYIDGTVSFHPGPDAQWGEAVLNYPVAPATALWTDEGGRAEIEIGAARVRMDSGTELDINQIDDDTIALAVPQGRIDVTLKDAGQGERYVVGTPRGDVTLADGSYRIDAGTEQGPTRVATFAGSAMIDQSGQETTVPIGQEATGGPDDPPVFRLARLTPDAFDGWASQRDGSVYARQPPAGVPAAPGTDALAEYGTWRTVPDYGSVWTPADVPADWTPYSTGHWAWVAPWGWTWVDDAPWGFAPFHYGRWVQIGGAWSWVPVGSGVIEEGYEPVYAPALVTFLGDPDSIVVGFDGLAIGWVPLGPDEFWTPWFPVGFDYWRRANWYNVHRNRFDHIDAGNYRAAAAGQTLRNQAAARVVPASAVAGGRSVRTAALLLDRAALATPLRTGMPGASAPALPAPARGASVGRPIAATRIPPAPSIASAHPAPASAAAFRARSPDVFRPSAPAAFGRPAIGSYQQAPRPEPVGRGFAPPVAPRAPYPAAGGGYAGGQRPVQQPQPSGGPAPRSAPQGGGNGGYDQRGQGH